MDQDPAASISVDCKTAAEAARSAEAATREARQLIDSTGAQVAENPARRGNLLAHASREVDARARDVKRHASQAREAAERAVVAARRLGTRADDPTSWQNEQVQQAVEAATRADEFASEVDELRKQAIADLAVEKELKLHEFFDSHREQIFRKLEECDRIAEHAPTNRDMTFIAESLPIINSIIHVGSDRATLMEAGDWVRDTWGKEADPLIVLSALMFMYVANKGAEENEGDEVWQRIQARVQRLM